MGVDGFVFNHAFCAEPLRAAPSHQSLPQPLRLFMTFICVQFPDGGARKHTSSSFDCVLERAAPDNVPWDILHAAGHLFVLCINS